MHAFRNTNNSARGIDSIINFSNGVFLPKPSDEEYWSPPINLRAPQTELVVLLMETFFRITLEPAFFSTAPSPAFTLLMATFSMTRALSSLKFSQENLL